MSFGNIIRPHRTRKKTKVWTKKPDGVGAPWLFASVKNPPNTRCVSLKVSGFATRKKTRVE